MVLPLILLEIFECSDLGCLILGVDQVMMAALVVRISSPSTVHQLILVHLDISNQFPVQYFVFLRYLFASPHLLQLQLQNCIVDLTEVLYQLLLRYFYLLNLADSHLFAHPIDQIFQMLNFFYYFFLHLVLSGFLQLLGQLLYADVGGNSLPIFFIFTFISEYSAFPLPFGASFIFRIVLIYFDISTVDETNRFLSLYYLQLIFGLTTIAFKTEYSFLWTRINLFQCLILHVVLIDANFFSFVLVNVVYP